MKEAIVTIEGIASLSMSRVINPDEEAKLREKGESIGDFDKRCWKEKAHYDRETKECFVPGMALKMHLDWTVGQMGTKIQGRGNKMWKSVFAAGVMCFDNMMIGTSYDDLEYVDVYCDAQGRKGSTGGRVWRRFPIIHEWGGTVTYTVLDDQIPEEIFRQHMDAAGAICGLGRWRAGVGGQNGRYVVRDFKWKNFARPKAA